MPALRHVVAAAAVAGGLLWVVKSVAILATGDQPPVTFEAAVACFAVVAAVLPATLPEGIRRAALLGVGAAGLASAVIALVGGEATEPFLLPASLATLVVLVVAGVSLGRGGGRTLALLIGLGTIPLIAVGGLLETVDERLLEVPLLVLALLWIAFGVVLATGRHAVRAL